MAADGEQRLAIHLAFKEQRTLLVKGDSRQPVWPFLLVLSPVGAALALLDSDDFS